VLTLATIEHYCIYFHYRIGRSGSDSPIKAA
jgi:hypothetical protein